MKRNKTSKTNLLLILPWIGIFIIVGGVIYIKTNERKMQKAEKSMAADMRQTYAIETRTISTQDFLVDALKTLLLLSSPYASSPTTPSSTTISIHTVLPTPLPQIPRGIPTPVSSTANPTPEPSTTLPAIALVENFLTTLIKLANLILHNVQLSQAVALLPAPPPRQHPTPKTVRLIPIHPNPFPPPINTAAANQHPPPAPPTATDEGEEAAKRAAKKAKVLRVMKQLFMPMFGLVIGLFILHACVKPCFNSNLRLRGESNVQLQMYPRVI
jgi:hypothetical protein